MNIISLFSGAGGLDLGFSEKFNIIWANEFDKKIKDTYLKNHPGTFLDTRSILDIDLIDTGGNIDGIIGGPPCQSWSLGGNMRGLSDTRGQLFYEYIRVLKNKKPKFFMLENVKGILSQKHIDTFNSFLSAFKEVGYNISYKLINVADYGVPQDRERVILIGYRIDLCKVFDFEGLHLGQKRTLRDAIGDLPEPKEALPFNKANKILNIPNHEYFIGSFSSRYMSRNRRRNWDQQSFTIQAGGRHIPLHPASNPMLQIGTDDWIFDQNTEYPYRRLSVRECARIQTFPDNFIFIYSDINDGYKMIGNAVPVDFAKLISSKIYYDFC